MEYLDIEYNNTILNTKFPKTLIKSYFVEAIQLDNSYYILIIINENNKQQSKKIIIPFGVTIITCNICKKTFMPHYYSVCDYCEAIKCYTEGCYNFMKFSTNNRYCNQHKNNCKNFRCNNTKSSILHNIKKYLDIEEQKNYSLYCKYCQIKKYQTRFIWKQVPTTIFFKEGTIWVVKKIWQPIK